MKKTIRQLLALNILMLPLAIVAGAESKKTSVTDIVRIQKALANYETLNADDLKIWREYRSSSSSSSSAATPNYPKLIHGHTYQIESDSKSRIATYLGSGNIHAGINNIYDEKPVNLNASLRDPSTYYYFELFNPETLKKKQYSLTGTALKARTITDLSLKKSADHEQSIAPSSAASAAASTVSEHDFLSNFTEGLRYLITSPSGSSEPKALTFVGFLPQAKLNVFDQKETIFTEAQAYTKNRLPNEQDVRMSVVFKDNNDEPIIYRDEELRQNLITLAAQRPPLVTETTYAIGSVNNGYKKLTYIGYYNARYGKDYQQALMLATGHCVAPYEKRGDSVLLAFKDEAENPVVYAPSELNLLDLLNTEEAATVNTISAPVLPQKSALKQGSRGDQKSPVSFGENETREYSPASSPSSLSSSI